MTDDDDLASGPDTVGELADDSVFGPRSMVTTVEEVQGYELVKTLVDNVVDASRVTMRDTQSYCGVLLDDNNRKTICRLRFNATSVKYLGLLDDDRQETRYQLDAIADIANYADEIRAAVQRHLTG